MRLCCLLFSCLLCWMPGASALPADSLLHQNKFLNLQCTLPSGWSARLNGKTSVLIGPSGATRRPPTMEITMLQLPPRVSLDLYYANWKQNMAGRWELLDERKTTCADCYAIRAIMTVRSSSDTGRKIPVMYVMFANNQSLYSVCCRASADNFREQIAQFDRLWESLTWISRSQPASSTTTTTTGAQ